MENLRRIVLTTSFLYLILTGTSLGQNISVVTEIDKNPANLDDLIKLTVTVKGVRQSSPPQLPDLPDFKVQGQSTSSSINIINGVMTASVNHIYHLLPQKIGNYELGPVKIEVRGTIYQSNRLTITIQNGPTKSAESGAYTFAKLSISNAKPYINEQTNLILKLYRRTNARNISLDWNLNSFRHKEIGKEREFTEIVNGLKYIVHQLQVGLFGIQAGSFKAGPATIELDLLFQDTKTKSHSPFNLFFNDPFFGGGQRKEHKILRSNFVNIKVQPFPQLGKPNNFERLVGRFAIQAELGKPELESGDTTTLTVSIRGTGNLETAEIGPPKLGKNFKVYPDKPKFQESISGRTFGGEKTFKFALVPLKPGDYEIPEVKLTYFDPEAKKYQTIRTKSISLRTIPSKTDEQLKITPRQEIQSSTPRIKILGKDILPNHNKIESFVNYATTESTTLFFFGALTTPPIIYFSIFFFIRRQRRMNDDTAIYRTRRAYKNAHLKLRRIANERVIDNRELAQYLSQTFREYIGDKLNMPGAALTPAEVEAHMKKRSFPKKQTESIIALLEKYQSLQYGISSKTSKSKLIDESLHALSLMEKKS